MSQSSRMIAWALTAALLFLLVPENALAATDAQPNIIFILTDDQRLEDIKHMPILQRELVEQGTAFANYFSTVSLCCPSRVSILRGQYAHNSGVLTNQAPNGGFGTAHVLGVENSTIATWLRQKGYATALIGKYLNHYPGRQGPRYVPPGWDYWASSVEGNAYAEYNYTLNENGQLVHYGESADSYGTDVYARKAREFIKSSTDKHQPFFLYLAFYAPHSPATPAPRHLGLFADAKIPRSKAFNEVDVSAKPRYIKDLSPMTEEEIAQADAYYGKRLRSLQAVDEAIESLCQYLSETKQLDNTYIAFASDNGFHLGEHRMRRGKQTAYETDIHLPLIVRGPGVPKGKELEELVGNIDLAPTFAELAGADVPSFVDGRSLVPLLEGKGASTLKWRTAFLVEHWQRQGAEAPGGDGTPVSGASDRQQYASFPAGSASHRVIEASDDRPDEATGASHQVSNDDHLRQATGLAADEEELSESLPDSLPEKTKGAPPSTAGRQQDGAAAGSRRARRRRRNRNRPGADELGRIPEFHALRGPHSTYVEYVTGEREYYDLTQDADEIDNQVGKSPEKTIGAESNRVREMKASSQQSVRELEDAR